MACWNFVTRNTPAVHAATAASPYRAGYWVTYACMAWFGLILLLMGALLPVWPGLSDAQAGTLGAMPLLGILITTFFTGFWLERWGAKPVLGSGLLLIAAAVAAMPEARDFTGLAGLASIYGLGAGVLNTGANALIAMLEPDRRGAALNLLGFYFGAGAVGAPLLMTLLLAWGKSRSWGLELLAGLTLLLALALFSVKFPPLRRQKFNWPELKTILRQPVLWGLGLLLIFETGNEDTWFVWSGRFAERLARATASEAEWALLAVAGTMALGRLLAAFWLRRDRYRRMLQIQSALLLISVACLAWAAARHAFASLLPGMIGLGLGMAALYPTLLGMAGDYFPGQTGAVFSTLMTLGLVGGTLEPKLAGLLATHAMAWVLAIPAAAALLIAGLGPRLTGKMEAKE